MGHDVIRTSTRNQISYALFILGLLAMLAVIGARYLRDGSFWIDEASVALSFRDLPASQFDNRRPTSVPNRQIELFTIRFDHRTITVQRPDHT